MIFFDLFLVLIAFDSLIYAYNSRVINAKIRKQIKRIKA